MIQTDNVQIPLTCTYNQRAFKALVPLCNIGAITTIELDGTEMCAISFNNAIYYKAGSSTCYAYSQMSINELQEHIDKVVSGSLETNYSALRNSRLNIL
jgi:hypothetical protein